MAYTTIDDPEAYFQVKLYTGNGSADHAMTFDGDTNMQPNVVWIKTRSNSSNHQLHATHTSETYHYIRPNSDAAEITSNSTALTSFDSDGFTIGSDGVINENTYTYVAYCWKETADAGMDIVTWTGNGSNRTISHSLSAVPKTIWVKERSNATNWAIYHQGAGNTNFLKLNDTAANEDTDNWQDTTPTSSVFSLGSGGQTNTSSRTYVAFCFAEKQGYSKFGSYEGNDQSSDNAFVYTGFRPAWVMIKNTENTYGWVIVNNKALGYNPDNNFIYANATDTESTNDWVDLYSNGFKIRSNTARVGSVNETYVYAAFAEAPFVNSNGVPCNAR